MLQRYGALEHVSIASVNFFVFLCMNFSFTYITPVCEDSIKRMRANLAMKLRKRRKDNTTYLSATNATGRLSRSLRIETTQNDDSAQILIRGTNYWREADSGHNPNTPIPLVRDLREWGAAKGVPISPFILQRKLIMEGPNRPYSKFATIERDNIINNVTQVARSVVNIDEIRFNLINTANGK